MLIVKFIYLAFILRHAYHILFMLRYISCIYPFYSFFLFVYYFILALVILL